MLEWGKVFVCFWSLFLFSYSHPWHSMQGIESEEMELIFLLHVWDFELHSSVAKVVSISLSLFDAKTHLKKNVSSQCELCSITFAHDRQSHSPVFVSCWYLFSQVSFQLSFFFGRSADSGSTSLGISFSYQNWRRITITHFECHPTTTVSYKYWYF